MAVAKPALEGMKPSRGVLTFDAEGQEGGPYHSRKLHVPSDSSGLTIGRGYDMKERSAAQILRDLVAAGVPKADATAISKAAGLSGKAARDFIAENDLAGFEITSDAQLRLFETTYASQEAEVVRICSKDDVVETYGATDWGKTHPAIRDLVVDLKFRGDYTGKSRKIIQPHIVANDLDKVLEVMSDKDNWNNVPLTRFNERKAMLEAAVAERDREKARARPPQLGGNVIPLRPLR